MNAEEALTKFTQKEFDLLTSRDFNPKTFKRARHSFYEKINKGRSLSARHLDKKAKRVALPSLWETQRALVHLMSTRGLQPPEVKDYVDRLPVFSQLHKNKKAELYANAQAVSHESSLSPEHIETIRKVGAFEAVAEHKGAQIAAEKHSDLRQLDDRLRKKRDEIAAKEKEFRSLPSVLDAEEVAEPEYLPEVEEVRQWWERFYLKENPFRRKDGLSTVSESLYEEVVVKTKPFVDALGALEKDPGCFFNTASLLSGGFGFGKTTFIDYLSYHLVHKNIIPLRITCLRSFPDASGFTDNFFIHFRSQLVNELKIVQQAPIETDPLSPVEMQVIGLAEALLSGKPQGMVVFLDDYHKHRAKFESIYEFLGTLQILKDECARRSLQVGFVVAGLPEWALETTKNTQMSGFLDGPVYEMPSITPERVSEVFNQRVRAYCYDSSPRAIKLDFVRQMFKEAEGRMGYRSYLNHIINELSNNNYAIVNTPIEIDDAALKELKDCVEADPVLKAAFNKLVYESKFKKFNREQVAKCVELLVVTIMQEGVFEHDLLFLDNRYYFMRLRDVVLIQKKRIAKKKFKWVAHRQLQQKLDEITETHGKSASDFLLKAYAWEGYGMAPEGTPSDQDDAVIRARRLFASPSCDVPKSAKENLQMATQLYDAMVAKIDQKTEQRKCLELGRRALEHLSTAFFDIEGCSPSFADVGLRNAEERWRAHWFDSETMSSLLGVLGDFDRTGDAVMCVRACKTTQEAFRSLCEVLCLLVEDLCVEGTPVPLLHNTWGHMSQEFDLLEQVRGSYFSADRNVHFRAVDNVTNHLELRFRSFLYATTQLRFGRKYFDSVPDAGLRKYAYKNIGSRRRYSTIENLYDGLTRSQFRNVLLGGGRIKKEIVSKLPVGWKTDDWERFFDLFAEANILTAHQQDAAFSPRERNEYLRYARFAEELMAAMNRIAGRLTTGSVVLVAPDPEKPSLESVEFRFDFSGDAPGRVVDPSRLRDFHVSEAAVHRLSRPVFDRARDAVLQKVSASAGGYYIEDLLDCEYIATHYNVNFAEFVCTVAYMAYVEGQIQTSSWFGSSVFIQASSP